MSFSAPSLNARSEILGAEVGGFILYDFAERIEIIDSHFFNSDFCAGNGDLYVAASTAR